VPPNIFLITKFIGPYINNILFITEAEKRNMTQFFTPNVHSGSRPVMNGSVCLHYIIGVEWNFCSGGLAPSG